MPPLICDLLFSSHKFGMLAFLEPEAIDFKSRIHKKSVLKISSLLDIPQSTVSCFIEEWKLKEVTEQGHCVLKCIVSKSY